jgi:hypothetical protein
MYFFKIVSVAVGTAKVRNIPNYLRMKSQSTITKMSLNQIKCNFLFAVI